MDSALVRLTGRLLHKNPPCIETIISMRYPNAPSRNQSFHLACWLLNNGHDIDECKSVFKEIFRESYDEETADLQLKLIRIHEIPPFTCFMVDRWLGVCKPSCPHFKKYTINHLGNQGGRQ